MHVFFRVDASSKIGLGHITRCIALAFMLRDIFELTFICKELPDSTASELLNSGFVLKKVEDDFDLLRENITNQIVVLDGYNYSDTLRNAILSKSCKLVCIHDYETPDPFADLIINHTPGIDASIYCAKPEADFALGLNFALLRPKFLYAAKQKRTISTIHTVFIGFGGSDYMNYTSKALQVVSQLTNLKKIIVVTGVLYPFMKLLVDSFSLDTRIECYQNIKADQVLSLMLSSDLAIVPSSGMLLEASAAGCLIVTGYFVDNQEKTYRNIVENYKVIGAEDFAADKIVAALEKGFKTVPYTQNLIDGNSDQRLISKFIKLRVEIRKANIEDCQLLFDWVNRPEVRNSAIDSCIISFENHHKWFISKLNSELTYIFILEFANKPIGQIRYDKLDSYWYIDYFIDTNYRGYGLGKLIIQKSLALNDKKKFKAIVKIDNYASQKVFKSLEFKETGCFHKQTKTFLEYELQ